MPKKIADQMTSLSGGMKSSMPSGAPSSEARTGAVEIMITGQLPRR